jgi:hypothetical protein
MQRIKIVFWVLFIANSAFSQIMSFGQTKIEEGTIIIIKSMSNITSKTNIDGELIDFVCAEDIYINNRLVIKKNIKVGARIENSDKAKGLGKEGALKIIFNYITAIDGQNIPISGVYNYVKGINKSGTAVSLSFVLSPLFLFLKGNEAIIPIGSLIEVYTTQEIEIKAQ